MSRERMITLGSVFILASGFVYTMERLITYVHWLGQTNTGSWETYPSTSFFDNGFAPIFLLTGIGFLAVGTRHIWMTKSLFDKQKTEE